MHLQQHMEGRTTSPQRAEWVDCCKGICIVLVVYGHIVGGLTQSGVVPTDSFYATLRDWVYLFHIPAFFFLSGLFAHKANSLSFGAFLRRQFRVLGYPYLLWTAIVLVAQLVMGSFVNTPASASRALRCLWEPYGVGLWFLYSLFLSSLLFYGLRRWRLPTVAILAVGVVGYVLGQHKVLGFWYILSESMNHAIFFMIGGCFPGIVSAPFVGRHRGILAAASVGVFAIMTLSLGIESDPTQLLKLSRALLGVAGVVCVAIAISRTRAAAVWAVLGATSLEIYLAHPLWGTASRGVLLRLGVHAPVWFVVIGVLLGVAGSLAMALACKRLGFPYLFRWPAREPVRERLAADQA